MTKQTTHKKCPRCSGTGVYAQRGVCFSCNGNGAYVADPFTRVFGLTGEFFGITGPVINGKQIKSIARAKDTKALLADLMDGYTFKSINEEQARIFFKRHGVSTEVAA
jgi:hypothetical protein